MRELCGLRRIPWGADAAGMRRYLRLVLAVLVVAWLAAPGGAPAQPATIDVSAAGFPGARGRIAPASPEAMLRALYGARGPRGTFADPKFCGRSGCAVKLLANEVWASEDGRELMLLVGAAEPKDAAHAIGAMLGMALLQRDDTGWKLVAGAPGVDIQGAWGEPPATAIVLAGDFGRGVIATPEVSAQGVALTTWHLYLPLHAGGTTRFTKVLQIETGQDSLAACERNDTACKRRSDVQDFSSTVTTGPTADGGMEVVQAITPATRAGPPPEIRRWVISPDGRVTQTSGRREQRRDR